VNFLARKPQILALVAQRGSVEVRELAEQLNTSDITIRRDLARLAADGLVQRTHGGAMHISLTQPPVSFANKAAINADAKDHICRLAVQQIDDGDVLFLDCGSTVFRLCAFIRHKPIRVITNSLPVVAALLDSAVSVNLIGGEVDAGRQAVHGLMAEEHIARYRADKAFVGVDGLSINGLSANSEVEAAITRAMLVHSDRAFLLADAGKLGRDKYVQFAPLSAIHALITDPSANAVVLNGLRNAGLTVMGEK
jgi:DeoR family transcriptional regulator, fructose operon transcriptional repressor